MLAAGVESMSMVPMMGNKIAFNPAVFEKDEALRHRLRHGPHRRDKWRNAWKVSREAPGMRLHCKAISARLAAIAKGEFKDETTPYEIVEHCPICNRAKSN